PPKESPPAPPPLPEPGFLGRSPPLPPASGPPSPPAPPALALGPSLGRAPASLDAGPGLGRPRHARRRRRGAVPRSPPFRTRRRAGPPRHRESEAGSWTARSKVSGIEALSIRSA